MHKSLQNKADIVITSLINLLNGLRSNRASIALLDAIKVDVNGYYLPLNQISTINIINTSTLSVHVWDKKLITNIQKAILQSKLGITPNINGQIIKLEIPRLNEDRRKTIVKKANEYSEQAKISIRNIRKNCINELKKQKKNKLISGDMLELYSTEIQIIIDNYIKKINGIIIAKAKDIMTV